MKQNDKKVITVSSSSKYEDIIGTFKLDCYNSEEEWYRMFCKRYNKKDISLVVDFIVKEYNISKGNKKRVEKALRQEMAVTIRKFEQPTVVII